MLSFDKETIFSFKHSLFHCPNLNIQSKVFGQVKQSILIHVPFSSVDSRGKFTSTTIVFEYSPYKIKVSCILSGGKADKHFLACYAYADRGYKNFYLPCRNIFRVN